MVTKKPKGLGMGLEALLGPKIDESSAAAGGSAQPTTLKLSQMQAGRYQPRTRMDEGSLYELAESIRSQVSGRQTPLLRVKKEKRGDLARIEEQLADKLAAVVEIRMLKKTRHGESGEIAISFGSNDELGGLLERLGLADEQ